MSVLIIEMLSYALMIAATPQIGSDAKAYYTAMQARIREAEGFVQDYIWYGAPERHVGSYYDRSGRFSLERDGETSLACDGKWFLQDDSSGTIHRRAEPSEILYVEGMESIYPNVPPLQVFGVIEKVTEWYVTAKQPALIRYRPAGKKYEASIYIDLATGLPMGTRLIAKGEKLATFKVQGFLPQSEVVALAAKTQSSAKSLLIRMRVFKDLKNDKGELTAVWVRQNGQILVGSDALRHEQGKLVWVGSRNPVSPKSIALPGFETFLKRKPPKVRGDSSLAKPPRSVFTSWTTVSDSGAWPRVRYDRWSYLPTAAISADGTKQIVYDRVEVNPVISFPKSKGG